MCAHNFLRARVMREKALKNVRCDVSITIRLQTWYRRDGREWLAWCPAIDVMSQARTKVKAMESLREAVELWFESCFERGVLNEALVECGFSKIGMENVGDETDSSCDQVSIRKTQTSSHPVPLPARPFSLSQFKGDDFIDGTIPIPAYIAASKLKDVAFARG